MTDDRFAALRERDDDDSFPWRPLFVHLMDLAVYISFGVAMYRWTDSLDAALAAQAFVYLMAIRNDFR